MNKGFELWIEKLEKLESRSKDRFFLFFIFISNKDEIGKGAVWIWINDVSCFAFKGTTSPLSASLPQCSNMGPSLISLEFIYKLGWLHMESTWTS